MKYWIFGFLTVFISYNIQAIERRRDAYNYSFNYFIYPIFSNLAPYGLGYGVGGTLKDIQNTDLDLTAINITGDFSVSALSLFNFHILSERLIFDCGVYAINVPFTQYQRGADSDKDDFYAIRFKGDGQFANLTLTFFDKMLEFYHQEIPAFAQILSIQDANGREFENTDNKRTRAHSRNTGALVDWTDDDEDPHKGIRFEYNRSTPFRQNDYTSQYYTEDFNTTFYIPIGDFSTLAFNYFESQSTITEEVSTDMDELKKVIGLNCNGNVECEIIEAKLIENQRLLNKNGSSTPLGGTQRLRSYPTARFTAGHTRFFGAEFRWNLTDENSKFDYSIMRGIRTSYQIAFFYGIGSVAETSSELGKVSHRSYGGGLRLVLEGTIIRYDIAVGKEGTVHQVFIDYPWGLNSI